MTRHVCVGDHSVNLVWFYSLFLLASKIRISVMALFRFYFRTGEEIEQTISTREQFLSRLRHCEVVGVRNSPRCHRANGARRKASVSVFVIEGWLNVNTLYDESVVRVTWSQWNLTLQCTAANTALLLQSLHLPGLLLIYYIKKKNAGY